MADHLEGLSSCIRRRLQKRVSAIHRGLKIAIMYKAPDDAGCGQR
jgi:hypothetical protein